MVKTLCKVSQLYLSALWGLNLDKDLSFVWTHWFRALIPKGLAGDFLQQLIQVEGILVGADQGAIWIPAPECNDLTDLRSVMKPQLQNGDFTACCCVVVKIQCGDVGKAPKTASGALGLVPLPDRGGGRGLEGGEVRQDVWEAGGDGVTLGLTKRGSWVSPSSARV